MRSIRALFLAVVAVSLWSCCCEPQPRVIRAARPAAGRRGRRRRRHRRTDPHARSAQSRRGRPRHPGRRRFARHVGGLGRPLRELEDDRSSTFRPTASRCRASSSRTRTCAPSDAACGSSTSGARASSDAAAAMVAEAAKNAAPGAWILGRGWNQTRWSGEEWPNRMQLDQAAPGNPVALTPGRRPRVVGQHPGARARRDQQGDGRARRRRDHARSDGRADGHPRGQRDGRGPGPHRAPVDRRRGAGGLPARARRKPSRTGSRRSSTAARPRTSCCS